MEKVRGSSRGGVPVLKTMLADDFVAAQIRVDFPGGKEGDALVTIGQEVLEEMNGLYRQCMMLKVLAATST